MWEAGKVLSFLFPGVKQKALSADEYQKPVGTIDGKTPGAKSTQADGIWHRDLEFFKLRILAIHEAKYAFTG